MLIALHKPYGVLCQFSASDAAPGETLADYISHPDVYPAGRLDRHSEGLLLLTDNGRLQERISHPKTKTSKEYWVQLEKPAGGEFTDELALSLCTRLQDGAVLKDGHAAAVDAWALNQPSSLERIASFGAHPGNLPAHRDLRARWFALTLTSGRNRIVRRLCANLGHPVLRLVRTRIGSVELGQLKAGESRETHWDSAHGQ